MKALGARQRLGIVLAAVVVAGAYAGVARAEESVLAEPLAQEVEAVAESTDVADRGSGQVSKGQPPGQSKKHSTGPSAPTEPAGDGGETTEPTPAVTEPADDGGETTEPAPAGQPVSSDVEPAPEPVIEAAPTGGESLVGGPTVVISSDVLLLNTGLLLAESRPDSSAAPSTGVHPADEEGSKPATHLVDDSGSVPPLPQTPASAGATGASGASAGGGSSAAAALVALLALAPLLLSGVLRLLVTSLRSPMLVADVQRPG